MYEVCGQVIKSVAWTNNNALLSKKLIDRAQRALTEVNGQSRFRKGSEESLRLIIQNSRNKRSEYEIIAVQPGILNQVLKVRFLVYLLRRTTML